MMTREEAIELKAAVGRLMYSNNKDVRDYNALIDFIESALRPVTREQVEKVWRGCPECKPRCGLCIHIGAWDKYGKPYVCEQCADCSNFKSDQKFCEVCGAPMTDEAAQMVMERMETLHENRD